MPIQQITTGIIADGAITVADVADATITGAKLAANTVTGNKIGQNAISSNNIVSVNASVATVGTLPSARLPAGSVLQVVSTTKTDTFSTTATSFTDVTGLSVSITPTSATSKILVIATVPVGHATSRVARVNLVRNSTAICQPTPSQTFSASKNGYVGSGDTTVGADFHFLDSPATTSATTYKIQVCTNEGDQAMRVGNRQLSQDMNSPSTITVMEIAG